MAKDENRKSKVEGIDFVWLKYVTDKHRVCRGIFPCKYCGEYTSCSCETCHDCFESRKDLEMENED